MISCVIPAYKARSTVCAVVRNALEYVDMVVVVDDACPQGSGRAVSEAFSGNPRVIVIFRESNGGVGAAMKSGLMKCLELRATAIVKIDADDQMDPSYIPEMTAIIAADPSIAYVKGNRFFDESILTEMPKVRLFGNAMLSLFAKFATGYWNVIDPTNGFVVFNGIILAQMRIDEFADSYFFEMSALGAYGAKRLPIAELEMRTIYGSEQSSLAIRRVVFEFPPRLAAMFLRRVCLQYFLFDINLGTLYLLFGMFMTLTGAGFGAYEYVQTAVTGVARTPGTVMLAFLPILIGAQLLMNALMYDVAFSPKTIRDFGTYSVVPDEAIPNVAVQRVARR